MKRSIYESGEYFAKHPDWHAKDSPFKSDNIIKMIKKNNLHPSSICEVGCGAGEILSNLYKRLPDNISFTGYEISPQAYKICESKKKDRLNFHLSDFIKEKEVKYDLLLLIDVFEHIPDYMGFLRSLRGKAKNIMFHIPLDMDVLAVARDHPIVHYRKSVGHLHYFTKNTALMTLNDCGYKILDFFYTAAGFELSGGTLKHRIFKIPRKVFFKINQDLAARFLGGFSLMVLTEPMADTLGQ